MLLLLPFAVSADSPAPETATPDAPAISERSMELTEPTVQAAYQGCSGPRMAATNPALEQRVVELTNVERANAGLPPLKLNAELSTAMRDHAVDMTEDDYFAHDSYDRSGEDLVLVCAWHERVRSYVPDAGAMAENIGWGYATPEAVVQAWMESDGHRDNLLRESYSELGVSHYASRWGQDFANRSGVYPVIIDSEAASTESTGVHIYAYGEWTQIRLRNDGGAWSEWRTFSNWMDWEISAAAGTRTVDVQMTDGETTVISSDSIEYTGETVVSPPDTMLPELNHHVFIPFATR